MKPNDLTLEEMREIQGGDWFETNWGVVLGMAFVAGFLGSGGLLALAMAAGAPLVLLDPSV